VQLNVLRKQFGFVFQSAALYDSMSVGDNVAFPLARHTALSRAECRQQARQLLASVGMEAAADKLPEQLSGGMRKRVGIARALALEPGILLFDEPTTGLDPITSGEISALILKLHEERRIASIVVTHDVQVARTVSDRVALLRDGRIVAMGTFNEMQRSQDGFVRQFLHSAG
jgi:phospholipid/cholesterol/gamma-HCH transport system ATP-binding protein